jgi:predicted ribosomally synthesized peptide with nif11-like leader
MSREDARALVERMKTDRAFRAGVLAVEDPIVRLAVLRWEGYDCTADELHEEGRRLDAAELADVVGGATIPR